jgi:hypothetical protein
MYIFDVLDVCWYVNKAFYSALFPTSVFSYTFKGLLLSHAFDRLTNFLEF